MHTTFGPLQVTLKYTYPRSNGSIVYQRAVPAKLRGRYPGANVKQDLKTTDIVLAAPESSPQALKVHGAALMKTMGCHRAPPTLTRMLPGFSSTDWGQAPALRW